MYFAVVFVFCLLFNISFGKNEIYMGSKVYHIKFDHAGQQEDLHLLKNDLIDFWRNPSFKHDITGLAMVPYSQIDWFEDRLRKKYVARNIHIEDVYDYLTEKEIISTSSDPATRNFDFNGYYRYDEILNYLNTLQSTNTTSIEIIEYGVTEQNRPLVYVKISTETGVDKPVIVIEAGINPREWITIPAAINVINELLNGQQTSFIEEFDWIVVPVLNPDGYEYTHTDVRLWTKSLSLGSNLGFICPGVNINRNFDINWLESDSSSSPCSHLYAGTEPFSEIESRLIRDIFEEFGSRTRLYISLQNNAGFVSYPWQFERASSGMFIQHYQLGLQMLNALNVSGYYLDSGSIALGDRASGTSSDFIQRSGVLYALNLDIMPDSDDGVIIPVNQIPTIVDSVWIAISVAANNFIN